MIFCIGLTGAIGTGKSTVADCFNQLGIEIINADVVAKALTLSNQPAFSDIVDHFGKSVLNADGELNRRLLFKIIIQDPSSRAWLENLLHPLILREIEYQTTQLKGPYGIIEIPLLKSKAQLPYLNRILVVKTLPEIQVLRIMKRYDCSELEATHIIKTQTSAHVLQDGADDVLMNTGTLEEVEQKVLTLHHFYLQLALKAG